MEEPAGIPDAYRSRGRTLDVLWAEPWSAAEEEAADVVVRNLFERQRASLAVASSGAQYPGDV